MLMLKHLWFYIYTADEWAILLIYFYASDLFSSNARVSLQRGIFVTCIDKGA